MQPKAIQGLDFPRSLPCKTTAKSVFIYGWISLGLSIRYQYALVLMAPNPALLISFLYALSVASTAYIYNLVTAIGCVMFVAVAWT